MVVACLSVRHVPHLQLSKAINAATKNAPYLPKGNRRISNLIQGWNVLTRITDMRGTSKVRGQDYNITSSVWLMCAHNSTKKSDRSTKTGTNVVRATAEITAPVPRSNGQRSRSPGRSGWHTVARSLFKPLAT